jgi:hypothetical protein
LFYPGKRGVSFGPDKDLQMNARDGPGYKAREMEKNGNDELGAGLAGG